MIDSNLPAPGFYRLFDKVYQIWRAQFSQCLQCFVSTFDRSLYFLLNNPVIGAVSLYSNRGTLQIWEACGACKRRKSVRLLLYRQLIRANARNDKLRCYSLTLLLALEQRIWFADQRDGTHKTYSGTAGATIAHQRSTRCRLRKSHQQDDRSYRIFLRSYYRAD